MLPRVFKQKINGTYYVVEAAFENRHNKLWVQSAYLSKNREDVTQVPDAADKPPEVTAKTDLPSPSSKNSLSQGEEKVNNNYISKEASSQEENASLFDGYELYEKNPTTADAVPLPLGKGGVKLNPNEVVEGILKNKYFILGWLYRIQLP